MTESLDTIGGRLRWAIERRPPEGRERGVRKFQRDMRARSEAMDGELPGITLTSIMSYLNDETVPSLTFIGEAAEVCGVRVEWLAFGAGEPFESEQRTDAVIVLTDFEERLAGIMRAEGFRSAVVMGTFARVVGRLGALPSSSGRRPSDDELLALAERLALFIRRGVRDHVLGDLAPEGAWSRSERLHEAAALATLHAVLVTLPEHIQPEASHGKA